MIYLLIRVESVTLTLNAYTQGCVYADCGSVHSDQAHTPASGNLTGAGFCFFVATFQEPVARAAFEGRRRRALGTA